MAAGSIVPEIQLQAFLSTVNPTVGLSTTKNSLILTKSTGYDSHHFIHVLEEFKKFNYIKICFFLQACLIVQLHFIFVINRPNMLYYCFADIPGTCI
mgnify:CR=1 FL=1